MCMKNLKELPEYFIAVSLISGLLLAFSAISYGALTGQLNSVHLNVSPLFASICYILGGLCAIGAVGYFVTNLLFGEIKD